MESQEKRCENLEHSLLAFPNRLIGKLLKEMGEIGRHLHGSLKQTTKGRVSARLPALKKARIKPSI